MKKYRKTDKKKATAKAGDTPMTHNMKNMMNRHRDVNLSKKKN